MTNLEKFIKEKTATMTKSAVGREFIKDGVDLLKPHVAALEDALFVIKSKLVDGESPKDIIDACLEEIEKISTSLPWNAEPKKHTGEYIGPTPVIPNRPSFGGGMLR